MAEAGVAGAEGPLELFEVGQARDGGDDGGEEVAGDAQAARLGGTETPPGAALGGSFRSSIRRRSALPTGSLSRRAPRTEPSGNEGMRART